MSHVLGSKSLSIEKLHRSNSSDNSKEDHNKIDITSIREGMPAVPYQPQPNQSIQMKQSDLMASLQPINGLSRRFSNLNREKNQLNMTDTSFRPNTRQSAALKITSKRLKAGKIAQKSASLLRYQERKQKPSVERIIQDLGDEKSELSRKICDRVERRANFKSGLLQMQNDYAPTSDYEWSSMKQEAHKTTKNAFMRPAMTAINFFSSKNQRQQTKPFFMQQSQLNLTTTAVHSASHNMLLANEWQQSNLLPA